MSTSTDPYEALARRLEAADAAPPAAIPRLADDLPAPLSFAQERLWFLDQYLADPRIYHIPFALRLRGPLSTDILARAVRDLTGRHEVLRTRFRPGGTGPRQEVMPGFLAELLVSDLPAGNGSDQDRIDAAIRRELMQPLDLSAGPPMRVHLLRVAAEDHLLIWIVHHIAFDGRSLAILERDLARHYTALAAGQPAAQAEPVRYRDYAAWQRAQAPAAADQLSYWRDRLAGLSALELPEDFRPPAAPQFRGDVVTAELSAELTQQLLRLAEQERTTLYAVIVTAFAVVLARHAGQQEVALGVPASLRSLPELEDIVGVFLNMLVLRTDLSGEPSFRAAVARVREALLDAYAHQDAPFEKLVEELRPARGIARTPFFDVVVNVLPELRATQFCDLQSEPVPVPDSYSGYAMTLYLQPGDGAARLHLQYQTERYAAGRMRHLLDQLTWLLAAAGAEPDRGVSAYSLVTPSARDLIPDPAAKLDLPQYEPVCATIAAAERQAPGSTAIRYQGRAWTYAELGTAVADVAAGLRAAGHQPGDVIAVVGEPSFGYLAALLGVMAGRGVVLPMDRSTAIIRQREMLSLAGARRLLLVGDPGLASELDGDAPPVSRIGSDGSLAGLPRAGSGRGLEPVRGDDPAYIYFTSGSSGVPKGILGNHNTLAHLITWERETFSIGPGDRCGLTTRLHFDMVLRDIFTTLTSGAALCVPPDETLALDAAAALRWLDDERITFLHIVPTLAARWLESVPAGARLPHLRWVYFAGEPLTEELVRGWRAAFEPGGGAAVNYYGTTETMVRTYHVIPGQPDPGMQSVGGALPHCQTVLVNQHGLLCGIDEIGEVLLRSRVCTYGYLNAPAEQTLRFLPNPFDPSDPGDICYRTGDVGRYLPDGTVEVLGRIDDQVKINGVRIEPAEVQAVLARHEAVASAVVIMREHCGEQSLVGYVVARRDADVRDTALRSYLRERLPDVMVPAAIVALDALPVLPNGKVDKKSLPPPPPVPPGEAAAALRTGTERALAQIWAATLNVGQIGPYDNFFDLGGHSLKVVDAVAAIRAELGVDVPLRTLFEEPTLASFARAVDDLRAGASATADIDAFAGGDDVDAIIAALEELEREEGG